MRPKRKYNIVADFVIDICKVYLERAIRSDLTEVRWETSDGEQIFIKKKDFDWMYYKVHDKHVDEI